MIHLGTKPLETPRLLLRPFTIEDAPAMYRNWASDPEVTRYLTWETYTSEETAVAYINELQLPGYASSDFYSWAIVLKSLGEPVGSISVTNHRDDIGSVEFGYCIGRPWWHQGVTSEALAEAIRFFFDEVGANRIEACHDTRNPNSGKVMEKCGMTCEGIHRQGGCNNQGICDVAWHAILKSEFRSPPPAGEENQDNHFSKRGTDL